MIGASANVATVGIAEQAGHAISFKRFFRTGFPIMIVSVILASAYLVVMYVIEWSAPWIPFALTFAATGGLVLIGRFTGPSDLSIIEEE